MDVQPQAPRLIIEHTEDMTTHKVAESLIKLAMMLRQLPDVRCTGVEFWLGGECQLRPAQEKSADG